MWKSESNSRSQPAVIKIFLWLIWINFHKKRELIPQEEDIKKEWDQIEKVMKESLQENVWPRRPKEKKGCFTEKCKRVLEERNKARFMLLNRQTEENQKRYEISKKRAKQMCRQEKWNNLNKKLKSIKENYKNIGIRNFYQSAKKYREAQQKAMTCLRKKNGKLRWKVKNELKRWVE
jgi:hypothetical protein